MLGSEFKTKQRDMSFQVFISTIFGEIISRHGVISDPRKLKVLTEMPYQAQKVIASIPWNNKFPEEISS